MLIELQIESLIKQIERDNELKDIKLKSKNTTNSLKTNSSTVCEDNQDNQSTTSSSFLYEITTSYFSKYYLTEIQHHLTNQLNKINKISCETFSSDKIVRMIGSILKVCRVFNLVQDPKSLEKLSFQIVQLRRLLRFNRIFSFLREIKQLIMKQNKKWLDFYNIIFKHLQFVLDINDTIGYFQQLKLIGINTFNQQKLKKNTANLYFVECLMFLFLNVYDYVKNRQNRTKTQNLRKQMTILKYVLDSFTSHNQFSRRIYTCNPKMTTTIGTLSSFIGLWTLWI